MNSRQAVVLVGLLVVGATLVAGPSVAAAPDGPAQTAAGNASADLGTQMTAFMQSNAARANDTVEDGLWRARFESADENRRDRLVADRTDGIADRIERLRERNETLVQRYRNGSISRAAYVAQSSRLAGRIAALRESVDDVERVANESDVAVDRQQLDRLRANASDLRGPTVAGVARGLAGPDVGPPGRATDRPPDDLGPGRNGTGPPGGDDGGPDGPDPPDEAGPPDERGQRGNDGANSGSSSGDDTSNDGGPPDGAQSSDGGEDAGRPDAPDDTDPPPGSGGDDAGPPGGGPQGPGNGAGDSSSDATPTESGDAGSGDDTTESGADEDDDSTESGDGSTGTDDGDDDDGNGDPGPPCEDLPDQSNACPPPAAAAFR